ncbi:MAG: DNA-binding protein HU 1 [Candidatus Marinimicrobia bacterium]|nr:DNA-binding protein HU 1 [Candidatus Neomarinimicrobiota bacterium]
MNKQEIIRQVAEAEGVSQEEAAAVVEELLQLITDRMKSGDETQIYGFGKFGRRWWKSRTGRDPQTGEEIEIEGRWIPYWTPSDTLIEEGEPHPKEREQGEAEEAEEPPVEEVEEDAEEEHEAADEDGQDIEEDIEEDAEESSEEEATAEAEEEPIEEEPVAEETDFERTGWEPPVREKSKAPGIIITTIAVIAVVLIAVFAFRDTEPDMAEQTGEPTAVESVEEPAPETGAEEQGTSRETPSEQPAAQTADVSYETETQIAKTGEPAKPAENADDTTEPVTAKALIEPPDAEPYVFEGDHRTAFISTYKDALHQFRDNDYIAALVMYERLQVSDPPESYADNVQYWIGECQFGLGHYREAIRAFEKVFLYPESNKIEDGLIMMASAYLRLQQFGEAKKILKKFQTQYSTSPYARIAQKWLREYGLNSGT